MKKSLFTLLLLIPSVLFAEDVKIGVLWYNLIDKAKVAEVTKCEKTAVDVVIPSNVEHNGKTYKVERIREKAFAHETASELKSVQIPEGVVEICEWAFSNGSLESVNIPNSVTIIGYAAFCNCYKLSSPIVLSNVEKIEENIFDGCNRIPSVQLSDKLISIGRYAFSHCEKLENISIPNNVKTIDAYAFQYCKALKNIHIPASVTDIVNSFYNAFQNCESLESITVDPNNPFYDSRDNCNAIVDKRLNRIVTGCQNTIIPNGIWEIGKGAFCGCEKLKAIDIPSSVYSIDDMAFKDCEELSSIIFHGDLSSFGLSVFQGCKSLTSIEIPNGAKELFHTFEDCSSLERVKLPNTVTQLDNSFKNCSNLTDFNIPEGVGNYMYAFDNCKKIKIVTLPYGVRRCFDFNGCDNLEKIYLPSTVSSVENSIKNCKSLLDVYCYASKPPSIGDSFSGSDIKYSTLHVPEESVDEYLNANTWKDFGKIIGIKIPEISKEDALSKLDILKDLCQKDKDAINNEVKDYIYIIPYCNLNGMVYNLVTFMQEIETAINNIKNGYGADYKPDYYQIEHLEKLWNETYHPQTPIVIARIKDMLSNLVTLTYKCNLGGKIRINSTWNGGIEISNETKQVQFVNPELRMENHFIWINVFALPDDGYHVESFKVGGVEQIGVSEYSEEQLINGLLRYNSLRFSYNDVEVVFASGESSIQAINAEGHPNRIYSINGMKVRENTSSLEGLPKGIYIVNGKKVIVK